MRRALALARRSPLGNPNPQVGCVIVDAEGRIVAEGWHRGAGTTHAEVDALTRLPAEWAARARELTAVVTLEPCNHTGRTGPCAQQLAEAGIGAVAYSIADPSIRAGGGAQTLREAGIEVIDGVLAAEGRALAAPWLTLQPGAEPAAELDAEPARAATRKSARPRVTVKWAQTLDGRAAAADGSSQWITGKAARADVHRHRAAADAILVGTGTLLADDPALTARAADGDLLVPADAQPIPVVLGRRAIPAGAAIRRHPALAAHGLAEPIRFNGDDPARHLADLHERGIRHLFVEGGPTIASALIAAGLVDDVLVYVAPALLGGPRLALGDLGITGIAGILPLTGAAVDQLGPDLRLTAAIDHRKEA
ncbi:MAG: bifunctional diaminohydroxyphosphoribosylaminopyrimidine deaminase/5-amino-6-(5-phosphoribosylamino)uracil reductase RibD [Leucobacter sp.]|nr:bifunctional diaminohydroxyphosphoribosylaminopyrimidine deaminase/5-amino-6-(5-phosphoribosylamino)uracil reductase RibD [Leucobacter sp.]